MLTTLSLNLLWDFLLPLSTVIYLRRDVRLQNEKMDTTPWKEEVTLNGQSSEQGGAHSLKYDLRSHKSVPRSQLEYLTITDDS